MLLSGGADGRIVVWDVREGKGEMVAWVRTEHRVGGVLGLAVGPLSLPTGDGERRRGEEDEEVVVYSAGSDRMIRRFTLSASKDEGKGIKLQELYAGDPIVVHETSVSALAFTPPTPFDDLPTKTSLWTASLDGTAKHLCLPSSPTKPSSTDISSTPTVLTTLPHGDYIRAIALSPSDDLIITAGRDETVKIWDSESSELVGTYEGHFGEVVGLCVIDSIGGGKGRVGKEGGGRVAVSISLDCTVRWWSLRREDIAAAVRWEGVVEEEGEEAIDTKKASDTTEELQNTTTITPPPERICKTREKEGLA